MNVISSHQLGTWVYQKRRQNITKWALLPTLDTVLIASKIIGFLASGYLQLRFHPITRDTVYNDPYITNNRDQTVSLEFSSEISVQNARICHEINRDQIIRDCYALWNVKSGYRVTSHWC
jgi:hypothetical protein